MTVPSDRPFRSRKVMKLIDPRTGFMECRVCGCQHVANIKPDSNGNFYRGSWQCQYGCRLDDQRGRAAAVDSNSS